MRKHKITLSGMSINKKFEKYDDLYEYIMKKIADGTLTAIKRSGTNGRKPALPNAYWIKEKEKDYTDVMNELKFRINPGLNVDFYMSHPEKYLEDKKYVKLISRYLTNNSDFLENEESINERSFEIFHEEKFLSLRGGNTILKRLDVNCDRLNYYKTTVPMAYYSHTKNTPQNILVVENKDTFYSIRKFMTEENSELFGMNIGTLIFGSGKTVISNFIDYADAVEPYFRNNENSVFYFGDLDYEGIIIYETLHNTYLKHVNRAIDVKVFINAYKRMIDKAEIIGFENLPDTKEGQNKNISNIFLGHFTDKYIKKIMKILESGKYIPQEILNVHDYRNNGEN